MRLTCWFKVLLQFYELRDVGVQDGLEVKRDQGYLQGERFWACHKLALLCSSNFRVCLYMEICVLNWNICDDKCVRDSQYIRCTALCRFLVRNSVPWQFRLTALVFLMSLLPLFWPMPGQVVNYSGRLPLRKQVHFIFERKSFLLASAWTARL